MMQRTAQPEPEVARNIVVGDSSFIRIGMTRLRVTHTSSPDYSGVRRLYSVDAWTEHGWQHVLTVSAEDRADAAMVAWDILNR